MILNPKKAGKSDLVTALQHELSCYPLYLFETAELLHEAQKAAFADSIWINLKQKDPPAPENPRYVLDGGALLYRIPWTPGSFFFHNTANICRLCEQALSWISHYF